jgi:hypothetical protein
MELCTRGNLDLLSFVETPRISAGVVLANRNPELGSFGFAVTPSPRHSAAVVALHRRKLARALGIPPESLVLQRQVHGTDVTTGEAQLPPVRWRSLNHRDLPESDLLISDRPGRALVLSVADCCPVLLFDPVRAAVAAVHAGWRGTAAGAADTAVRALSRRYGVRPGSLRAWVGPCAGGASYEVGPEVVEAFRGYPDALRPSSREGHALLDLSLVNRKSLVQAGIPPSSIEVADFDTIADRRFHSYRRDGKDSGRMAAWILMRR